VVPVVVAVVLNDVVAVLDCELVAELLPEVVAVEDAVVVSEDEAVDEAVVVAVVASHPTNSASRYLSRALLKRSARLSHLSLSFMMIVPSVSSHLKLLSAIKSSTRCE